MRITPTKSRAAKSNYYPASATTETALRGFLLTSADERLLKFNSPFKQNFNLLIFEEVPATGPHSPTLTAVSGVCNTYTSFSSGQWLIPYVLIKGFLPALEEGFLERFRY